MLVPDNRQPFEEQHAKLVCMGLPTRRFIMKHPSALAAGEIWAVEPTDRKIGNMHYINGRYHSCIH